MLKYKTYILLTIMTFWGIGESYGQHTANDRRQCLLKVIQALDDYEFYSVLDDNDSQEGFLSLFVNEEAVVYNDLLGLSAKKDITVKEYVNLRIENTKIPTIILKNIKKESIVFDGTAWKVCCSFIKEMSYSDKCGIYYSSKDFYGKDYNLKAYFIYNPTSGECKIERIVGDIDSDRRLSDDFYVLERHHDRDNLIIYNGEKLEFNAYNQSFINGPLDRTQFDCGDPDVETFINVDNSCGRIITTDYKVKRMRAKIHFDLGVGNAFAMDGNIVTTNSSNYNIGADLGYIFPSKSSLKTGFFAGVGMSQSAIKMTFNSSDYSFSTDQDVDGDTYQRHYRDLSLAQDIKLTEVTVPVYLDFDYRFNPKASAFVDLGVQLNYNIVNSIANRQASAVIDGFYPQYNITLDGDWGYNGFGSQTFHDPDWMSNTSFHVNQFTANILGRTGFRYSVTKSLAMEVGILYEKGLLTSVTTGGGAYNNDNIIFNTINNMDSYENIHNLYDFIDNVKRQSLKLNIGIIYKF